MNHLKNLVKIFVLFTIVIMLANCSQNSTNEKFIFKKVDFVNEKYVFKVDSIFDIHVRMNLVSTMIHHGVSFEVDDNGLINLDLEYAEDMNLLFNISNKSEDENWLKENIWKMKLDIYNIE